MSAWPSAKSRRVFAALKRIGWRHERTVGSHKMVTAGWSDYNREENRPPSGGSATLRRWQPSDNTSRCTLTYLNVSVTDQWPSALDGPTWASGGKKADLRT